MRILFLFTLCGMLTSGSRNPEDFTKFVNSFATGYANLCLPEVEVNYKEYFSSIPSLAQLKDRQAFFLAHREIQKKLPHLLNWQGVKLEQILHEIEVNLLRITLEMQWVNDGRVIPENGLGKLKNARLWYSFFFKKITTVGITPEAVLTLGKREMEKAKSELKRLQKEAGFADSVSFFKHLAGKSFFLTNRKKIESEFLKKDSIVRARMGSFQNKVTLAEITPMPWPRATTAMPVGMYNPQNDINNSHNKNVLYYNFSSQSFNKRMIDWLYLHTGVTGHHLLNQYTIMFPPDSLQLVFQYAGNTEGWAYYAESFGKSLGLYTDIYSEIGKYERDLILSARLIIDCGIHVFGWNKQQAIDYWKKHLPSQKAIAENEVSRIINFPVQMIAPVVGADFIERQKNQIVQWENGKPINLKIFHRTCLFFFNRPLEATGVSFSGCYTWYKMGAMDLEYEQNEKIKK